MTWDRRYEEERNEVWLKHLERMDTRGIAQALAIRDAHIQCLLEALCEARRARRNLEVSNERSNVAG